MTHAVHVKLAAHPQNPSRFQQRISATLTHESDGALRIEYLVQGFNLDLRIPTPHAPAPHDALWQTTCCELFIGAVGQSAYREFNFSPSGQWAYYDFCDTRQRAPEGRADGTPQIEFSRGDDWLKLIVTLPESTLPHWKNAETLRIGVSAILEAEGGQHAYWALAHPPGKPDFHAHAGFVLSLGAQGFRPAQWP